MSRVNFGEISPMSRVTGDRAALTVKLYSANFSAFTVSGVADDICKWVNENPHLDIEAISIAAPMSLFAEGVVFYWASEL